MLEPLKIHWAGVYEGIGNAYGYTTHNKNMRKYVGLIPGVELSDDAPVAIHINTADRFMPIEGKFNFLFSMYEAEHIPATFAVGANKADHIIVPCNHNKKLFEKYTDVPVSVCHEGCNPDIYTYVERDFPKIRPFRFLWVGAPNPRKGWEEILTGWWGAKLANKPEIELYLKTTLGGVKESKANVIYDSRNLSLKELVKLYHDAHCFILPTRGEGWGLTLTEAMATGLPCIATKYTGTADFFDSYVGYPIRYKMKQFNHQHYKLQTFQAVPDVEDMVLLMNHVYHNYKEALRKGRKAADRIRHKFTWPKAAERLVEIVREKANGI